MAGHDAQASRIAQLGSWSSRSDQERQEIADDLIDSFSRPEALNDASMIQLLAEGLASSGQIWKWPENLSPCTDVPSTGGVGSLTTLLCPYILAASGCFVPKVSVPGGTAGGIDVLSLLPGFRTQLNHSDMISVLSKARIAHSANSDSLAPADGYLFKRRKERNRVGVTPLAVASLLSKKLVVGCKATGMDIRMGIAGNFGADLRTCQQNAHLFVRVAQLLNIRTSCVINDISGPPIPQIGRLESLLLLWTVLTNRDSDLSISDHVQTCITIAGEGLVAGGVTNDHKKAYDLAAQSVRTGAAKDTFLSHIREQGAAPDAVDQVLRKLDNAQRLPLTSRTRGFLSEIDTRRLSLWLRQFNGDLGDSVGIHVKSRCGMEIRENAVLAEIRVSDALHITPSMIEELGGAFSITETEPLGRTGPIVDVIRSFAEQ